MPENPQGGSVTPNQIKQLGIQSKKADNAKQMENLALMEGDFQTASVEATRFERAISAIKKIYNTIFY